MSRYLETAIDIADALRNAAVRGQPLNVGKTAAKLARRHNGHGVPLDDIAAALTEESKAAGVKTK